MCLALYRPVGPPLYRYTSSVGFPTEVKVHILAFFQHSSLALLLHESNQKVSLFFASDTVRFFTAKESPPPYSRSPGGCTLVLGIERRISCLI